MKRLLKTAGGVAIAHLICFWLSYTLLDARWSHISPLQFFGIFPMPAPSHFEVFIQWVFIILGAPFSILLDGSSSAHLMPALILCSVLNSIVWGVILALPIYGISKRFHHVAA